jgi:hypothetical protein
VVRRNRLRLVNLRPHGAASRANFSDLPIASATPVPLPSPHGDSSGEALFPALNVWVRVVILWCVLSLDPLAPKHLWLKYAHALAMTYSWIAIIFLASHFLDTTDGFPYTPGYEADCLLGRCYGRDLRAPDVPPWLQGLNCGLGTYCEESSMGGPNL